jgi:hypothetical protein
MNLTLCFGGTGHNIKTASWEDKLISMFCKIDPTNYCAFHPGPGCAGSHIYANKLLHDLLPLKQPGETYDIEQTKFGVTAGMNKHEIKRIRTTAATAKKLGTATPKKLGTAYKTDFRLPKLSQVDGSFWGAGWYQNINYALQIIYECYTQLKPTTTNKLTVNLIGHSRGSITAIMLMNDIIINKLLPTYRPKTMAAMTHGKRTAMVHRVKYRDQTKDGNYRTWYINNRHGIWRNKLKNRDAVTGVIALTTIQNNIDKIDFNLYLNDPVAGGGLSRDDTDAKRELYIEDPIKHVRVILSEHGGSMLNGNIWRATTKTPSPYKFVDYKTERDVNDYSAPKKYVIPMPGSHGAALGHNIADYEERGKIKQKLGKSKEKYKDTRSIGGITYYETANERRLGTNMLLAFLKGVDAIDKATTAGGKNPKKDEWQRIYDIYNEIATRYKDEIPKDKDRKEISKKMGHTTAGYGNGTDIVNGMHAYAKKNKP